jgi:hypothetical protein
MILMRLKIHLLGYGPHQFDYMNHGLQEEHLRTLSYDVLVCFRIISLRD